MWPDQVSNPGPLTYESGALLTALRGPARESKSCIVGKGVWLHCSILAIIFRQQILTCRAPDKKG